VEVSGRAVVDYRLISHGAVFPSGGEDLKLAIDWVTDHLGHNTTRPLDLYLMGNSAGGVHLSTYLLAAEFSASRDEILSAASKGALLKGAVLLSVPFHFDG